MYLFVATLVIAYVFLVRLSLWYTACIAFVYLFWWFDGRQCTGDGRWPAFQSFRPWSWLSPIEYEYSSRVDVEQTDGKRLYVFIGGTSLVWAMGMHGNQIRFRRPVHYVLPPPMLWVPFIREWLLWTGAVTVTHAVPFNDLVLDLLGTGRSVCYAPVQFVEPQEDLEADIDSRYPTNDVLDLCRVNEMQIVPVVVHGERERYRIIDVPVVQGWFQRHLGYAFPRIYWYRLFHATRPMPVTVTFGPLLNASLYNDAQTLRDAMKQTVENIGTKSVSTVPTKATKGT